MCLTLAYNYTEATQRGRNTLWASDVESQFDVVNVDFRTAPVRIHARKL